MPYPRVRCRQCNDVLQSSDIRDLVTCFCGCLTLRGHEIAVDAPPDGDADGLVEVLDENQLLVEKNEEWESMVAFIQEQLMHQGYAATPREIEAVLDAEVDFFMNLKGDDEDVET